MTDLPVPPARPSGGGAEPERHRFRVEDPDEDRLDRFLSTRLSLSRSRVVGLIDEGRVRVNGHPVKKSYAPRPGDLVEVEVPPPPETCLEPEALPLVRVYEDDDLVVVEKPAGMVVHPAPGHRTGTLVHALLHHVDRLSSTGGDTRPGIVHRLDRQTSGLLVVAKTDEAHRKLSRALAKRKVRRGYLAGAWGHVDGDELTIDRPIGRDPRDRKKMAVLEETDVEAGRARPAVTHLRRLERWVAADLLAVRLETGRTHQIRVHLRHLGHPVVGDATYAPGWERGFVGAGARWAEALARRVGDRLFLHAAHLAFHHPLSGERLSFSVPLPDRLQAAVEWARRTSAPPAP